MVVQMLLTPFRACIVDLDGAERLALGSPQTLDGAGLETLRLRQEGPVLFLLQFRVFALPHHLPEGRRIHFRRMLAGDRHTLSVGKTRSGSFVPLACIHVERQVCLLRHRSGVVKNL